MKTKASKNTGSQDEAKTTKSRDSLMEMCISCCGDKSKMESMSKFMKDGCAGMPIPEEMRKKWRNCCPPANKSE